MPRLIINDAIPDGVLAGYDKFGRVIVCISSIPRSEILFGKPSDNKNVYEWSVCETHAKRISAVAMWRDLDYECFGNA